MNSSVAVSEPAFGDRYFHISGKIEASTVPTDMRLQRMLGHVPALLHPKPRAVLVVGCGAGVTAGSFVLYPDVERIVICEIEPLVPLLAEFYFADEEQRSARRSARPSGLRRCPALHSHHARQIRYHHIRSHPSLGQGVSNALYQGVL